MIVENKLREMGLDLPAVADPAGLYVYTRRVGNLVYVSGQTPDINSVLQYKGIVGETLSIEEGKKAAQLSALNVLSVLKRELGDLDRVKQFVHLTGFVRCANPRCITNHEPIETSFRVIKAGEEIALRCKYCEKITHQEQIEIRK